MGFWPLVHSFECPWSSQSFPRYRWRILEDFNYQEYILLFDVNCCLVMRLHFSIGCYDRRRIVEVVTVSSSAEFKSFFLVICIDAPESTTNSLSSSWILDGEERHHFSAGEKKGWLCFFVNFRISLASLHPASRAHRSCHSVSSWDRSSNFGALVLRWWGSPEQMFPSDGALSRMLAWRSTALVIWTHLIGFNVFECFRNIDEDFCGSLSWDAQPNCRVSFNIATDCTFVTILFGPVLGCSSTRWCAYEHFFCEIAPFFCLVERALWGMPLCTRWIRTSTFVMVLARQTRNCHRWISTSWTVGSRWIFHILRRRRFWRRCRRWRWFRTLITIVPGIYLFFNRTLLVSFLLPTLSWSFFFNATLFPLILN